MRFPPEIAEAVGALEPDTSMSQVTARTARALPIAKPQAAYRLWPAPVRAPAGEPRPASEPVQIRKLKYHVSASVDGYLLDEQCAAKSPQSADDSVRYLHSLHAYGIVLMGRGAYEAHLRAGVEDPYPHLMSYVFSSTLRVRAGSPVEVVAVDAVAWVRRLKSCPGKDLYLSGGTQLAASLFEAGLIDEVVVELSPVLRGSGRRLLSELAGGITLLRENSVAYDDGTVTLTYRVKHPTRPADTDRQ